MSKRAFYRVVWILSALAILAMTVVFAAQPEMLPIPGPVTSFTAGDNSFHLQRPGNWKARERSTHGVETETRFEPARNARMVITSDLQGSLMADLLKSGGSGLGSLPGIGGEINGRQRSPLEALHANQGDELAKDKAQYADFQDGVTQKTQVAGCEALVTDFSFQAQGAFRSRPMVGKRVTFLAGERRVALIYCCLKEMQSVLMPAFDKMRDSLTLGQPGG